MLPSLSMCDKRSLEKRSASRQIGADSSAALSSGRASLLRATALVAIVLALVGCAGSPLAFKWADEDGARIKASLTNENIKFVRNCEAWNVAVGSPMVQDETLTLTVGGTNASACFFTTDQRMIVVSPYASRPNIEMNLKSSLSWYAYTGVAGLPLGHWMDDGTGSPRGYFLRFQDTGLDGQLTANQTVHKHLYETLGVRPVERPPVRLRLRVG